MTSKNNKKRKIISDSEEELNNHEEEASFSISDIKKQATKRAKNLSKAMDDGEEEESTAKAKSAKKSPAPIQKNTMFNYFKKAPSSSSLNKSIDEKKPATKAEDVEISDDFIITTIVKDDVIIKNASKPSRDSSGKMTKLSKKIDDEEPQVETKKKDTKAPEKKAKEDEKKGKEESKAAVKSKNRRALSDSEDDGFETTVLSSSTKESPKKKETVKKVKKEVVKEVKEIKKQVLKEVKKEVVKDVKEIKKQVAKEVKKEVDEEVKGIKKEVVKKVKKEVKRSPVKPAAPRIDEPKRISELWVDKYKPHNLKQVIGMQTPKSPLNKLLTWLKDWHLNIDQKPVFNKFGSGNTEGIGFKAALLSGSPGIGKTTSAVIACKELGFDYMEMNASDKRSKKSVKEDVKELLSSTKLTNFFGDKKSKEDESKLTARHVLIMDEVDGMAGNEDRGGVAELIQLIKSTKIPIICICNDRSHPKMRSLVNYCFDLRFSKPKVEHIRGPLKSICFKEKVEVDTTVIDDLIVSSNFDIRQCIGNLAMITAGQKSVKKMVNQKEKAIKDVKLGPFDAIRKVFTVGTEYAMMSFADKSDLFFADYGIMPLFVFENYNHINVGSKEKSVAKQLKRMARSIDAISMGDIVEREIRSNQNWSLLPLEAAFSTVMPGSFMRSEAGLGFPQFPQYMGKISTTNKNVRLTDELVSHMTLSISGTRTSFALDYIEPLTNFLSKPLKDKGADAVPEVLDILENYALTRDNMNSLFELSLWTGEVDPLKNVDSKVKRTLTTAYNKKDFALPYASGDSEIKKLGKRGQGSKAKGSAITLDNPKEEADSEEEYVHDNDDDYVEDFY